MKDHIERLRISKKALGFTFFGLIAVVAVAGLRTLRPPVTATNDSYLNQLLNKERSLQEYTDVAVEQATAARSAAEKNLWAESAITAWRQQLPSKWATQDFGVTDGAFVNSRRILLMRKDASARDYAEILEVLRKCEALQGAHIQNVVIASSDPAKRRFDTVQFVLVFSLPKSSTKSS